MCLYTDCRSRENLLFIFWTFGGNTTIQIYRFKIFKQEILFLRSNNSFSSIILASKMSKLKLFILAGAYGIKKSHNFLDSIKTSQNFPQKIRNNAISIVYYRTIKGNTFGKQFINSLFSKLTIKWQHELPFIVFMKCIDIF